MIKVLETTLRDGSYVTDFQVTAEETAKVSKNLDTLGFELIEIGHGLGINASETKGRAAATDAEYLQAGKQAVKTAKLGMFCIPGIAKLDHLRALADQGLDFVRVGVDVDKAATARPFIELGKKLGLTVMTNFMKSYCLSVSKFRSLVEQSEDYGSDLVYLVDSAGGMLPDQVEQYVRCVTFWHKIPIGFHGHNNLGLAVANSLAAVEAGATLVDTTLAGIGRSSGNAPTEIMVPLLQKYDGSMTQVDALKLLELAAAGDSSERVALGLNQVHSSYLEKIRDAAKQHGKQLLSVIEEVGKLDRINLSQEILAKALANAREVSHESSG